MVGVEQAYPSSLIILEATLNNFEVLPLTARADICSATWRSFHGFHVVQSHRTINLVRHKNPENGSKTGVFGAEKGSYKSRRTMFLTKGKRSDEPDS